MKTSIAPMRMIDKRIRNAASMILFSLIVTLVSLLIFHPLSFIAYIILGIAIMIFANFYYLFALLSPSSRKPLESKVVADTRMVVEAEAA
jgi:hypothetical protein